MTQDFNSPSGRSVSTKQCPTFYLTIIEAKNTDISSMMNVVPAHDRIGVVLHPNTGERIATDFVIEVCALRVVCYDETDVLAVANDAVPNCRRSRNAGH